MYKNQQNKPKKLKKGHHIRIIAPVRSMNVLASDTQKRAMNRLKEFGFKISFGEHVFETNEFNSSSIESRVSDIHSAFKDDNVDAILTVIGGYNSNQLLQYIDYKLIANNPKIFCGYSDVTVLANAINAKTGMITYLGPHFSSWAMTHGFDYTLEFFIKCCMEKPAFYIVPSDKWSDDPWYLDQENRKFIQNEGYWILNNGHAIGKIVGGHTRCFGVLQGTEYWQSLCNTILILEEHEEINPSLFDRQLQSIIHQKGFIGVKGIIIGRFQKQTKMTKKILKTIIDTKKELKKIPIIANVDIGHTTPMATIPIGGKMEMISDEKNSMIKITDH